MILSARKVSETSRKPEPETRDPQRPASPQGRGYRMLPHKKSRWSSSDLPEVMEAECDAVVVMDGIIGNLAEREGFEPSVQVLARTTV